MVSKKIRKDIARFWGWLGLSFCSLIIKFIPEKWLLNRFAGFIATIGYRLASKQRKIALESLHIAFGPEKSAEEIKRIARQCFIFMAKSGVEIVFLMGKPNLLKSVVEIVGKDNLDGALARGRGVILVSAHFGNFPLMLAKLSLEGYRISGIMRLMRDSRVEKMFLDKRNQLKIKTIYSQPRKACIENTIRTLRNNELVFIPLDQNFGSGGVFVDFFGRKAATATGPIVLSQRTKAVILPCFIVRQPDDTHKIIFERPLDLTETDSLQENIIINVQRLTSIIESYIRRYPAEWGWIHRRWKSKPA